jgi:chorismate mutase/prephenate dehydratase
MPEGAEDIRARNLTENIPGCYLGPIKAGRITMELHEIREEIRQIDEEMAELFVRRMEAVRKVAAYKNQRGLPVLDREQEARVIQGRSALIKDPELQPFYREFLQETMDISKRWQVYLIQRKRDGMQC